MCVCVFSAIWIGFHFGIRAVRCGVELGGVSIVTAIKNCNKDNDKEGDDKKEKGLTQN